MIPFSNAPSPVCHARLRDEALRRHHQVQKGSELRYAVPPYTPVCKHFQCPDRHTIMLYMLYSNFFRLQILFMLYSKTFRYFKPLFTESYMLPHPLSIAGHIHTAFAMSVHVANGLFHPLSTYLNDLFISERSLYIVKCCVHVFEEPRWPSMLQLVSDKKCAVQVQMFEERFERKEGNNDKSGAMSILSSKGEQRKCDKQSVNPPTG